MKHHGFLTVSGIGEAEIELHFRPSRVKVEFVDNPPPQPPSCAPVREDEIDIDIISLPDVRGAIKISWKVNHPRKVRWDARGYSF